MLSAINSFRTNIGRVKELGQIITAVGSMTTGAIDLSDLWRSQIVLLVSALDHFVHELARLGMIEVARGNRPPTVAYQQFPVAISAAQLALTGVGVELWLGEAIREKHSWLSFQHPDKIADAVRLVSGIKLWEEVGRRMGLDAPDVKANLRAIIDRRNRIAHEADIDPANPGFRWPISEPQVADAIDFVSRLGDAVFDSVQ